MRRCLCLFLLGCATLPTVAAQTQLVQSGYFPAEFEFSELKQIISEHVTSQASELTGLPEGPLVAHLGFREYRSRTYGTIPTGRCSIETLVLNDPRAAYSLLTLLRNTELQKGPPGDFMASADRQLVFSQADVLVRIRCDLSQDLSLRIARSVSNRIGRRGHAPGLVANLPARGLQAGAVKYFLKPRSGDGLSLPFSDRQGRINDDVEVAQASYGIDGQKGFLSLVGFPTSQLADSYLERASSAVATGGSGGRQIFFRRAGPLLGILEGTFEPGIADSILNGIEFNYSVQWIFDKKRPARWGVSGSLLGTVVRSLLLTVILGGISLIAGISVAVFRVFLRGYAPNNILDRPDRTGMVYLRIHEK